MSCWKMSCWGKFAPFCAVLWLLILANFGFSEIWAQEGRIAVSGKDAWLPEYFDNVQFKQVEDIGSIITLANKEQTLRQGLDMLLHFNGAQSQDETGNYQIIQQPIYSEKMALLGKAAGFFQGQGGLVLRPGFDTFGGHGITDHDFSIDFWFYPFFAENGEVLFEWEGQLKLNEEMIPQRISAIFQSNRLIWRFRNVFLSPNQKYSLYEVSSDPYIPRSWYHHQLVYDEDNAVLEVLTDDRSDGVANTTVDQTAYGVHTSLMIDNPYLTNFSIGSRYFGLIDEWEISRINKHVELTPMLYYYPSGSVYSKVLDLENHNSQVHKIRIEGQQPENSMFLLYYSMSNDPNNFRNPNSLQWIRLKDNAGLFENLDENKLVGQYIQFKIELHSDSKTHVTPSLQGLEVYYYQHRLSAPPSNILVDNHFQGGVHVQWQPSVNSKVAGYKIFVGKYSGQYLEPNYPVDVGNDTSFLFSDLQPKIQYFFVIASYDKYGKIGPFSKEYSIWYIPD